MTEEKKGGHLLCESEQTPNSERDNENNSKREKILLEENNQL
jgi:hypothetical protein